MAIKKSVRLVDETIELCKILTQSGDPNWSGSLNSLAQRYNILIAAVMPELAEGEKLALCQAYNGHMLADDVMQEVAGLDWQVSEAIQYDENVAELLTHHGIDHEEFKAKARGWNAAERLAVIDMTQRFWARPV